MCMQLLVGGEHNIGRGKEERAVFSEGMNLCYCLRYKGFYLNCSKLLIYKHGL